MTNKEIKEKISTINVYKTKLMIFLKNHYPELYAAIFENTNFLNMETATFAERIYCIENDIHEKIKCPVCGKPVKFNTDTRTYRKTCSVSCSRKTEETMAKFHKTLSMKSDPFNIEKAKETRYTKNNGKWHADNFYDKVKTTIEERHGNPHWNNHEKYIKTSIERYGVQHPMKSEKIKKKISDSMMKLYKTDCAFKLKSIRDKAMMSIRHKAWINIQKSKDVSPIINENDFINIKDISADDAILFKCLKCGKKFTSYWYSGHARPCPHCSNFGHGSSDQEKQLIEFIQSISNEKYRIYTKNKINRNIIAPKEIDIIIADSNNIKFGIEYDGLYWHSEEAKGSNACLEKTMLCENKNIRLIHIFENEWLVKRNIVEHRIKNLLGIFDKTIYARTCKIKLVQQKESCKFQDENHLQGHAYASVNIGLFYNDELISLMTFSKSRFDKKHEWEMVRFCSKLGYHIPGAASRLLKYFEKNYIPKSLVTYADKRWSNGNLYNTLKFKYIHLSRPNYWYFKNHDTRYIYSRVNFQKHKLKDKLEIFDENKSEAENMKANGYSRIFDCGNMVFEKIYT